MSAITPNPTLRIPSLKTAELALALVFAVALIALAYMVQFDQGALSRSGMFMHELMHDGRHLLGVPCH